MSSSDILSARIEKSFDRALSKKGYLSLCSIIESQYKSKQSYPMVLRKNTDKIVQSSIFKDQSTKGFDLTRYKVKQSKKESESKYLSMTSLFDLA
ncbi:hypothetical protein [Photobacterium angustum]|uniref:hypothetical protein n=1 Tax=Photobacterium angustum TaxID=661 RepID=UPI000D16305C|nr:hypothetical protein [Photobacterium angustum]PSV66973.1 hypothetical protein CTM95_10045 [Photobacterium angustum]